MRSFALKRCSWVPLARDCFVRGGWLPMLVLLIHSVGVRCFDAYDRWPAFDLPMHFGGGIAIAFFFLRSADVFTARRLISPLDSAVLAVLVFALTAAAAVHWEFMEWFVDARFGAGMQMGLNDTLVDMLLGVVGGLLLLALWMPGHIRTRGRKTMTRRQA